MALIIVGSGGGKIHNAAAFLPASAAKVVIAGPPEHLLAHPDASHTARFLRQYVDGNGR